MFHTLNPKDLKDNVFSLIGDRWMLVTAGTAEHCNTMTASWGGLGVICGAPYFEQASLVLVCRKRFVQPMDPANIPQEIQDKWYPQKDFHTMYIGEIVEVLAK